MTQKQAREILRLRAIVAAVDELLETELATYKRVAPITPFGKGHREAILDFDAKWQDIKNRAQEMSDEAG